VSSEALPAPVRLGLIAAFHELSSYPC
jgi:hypothetical protein